MLTSPVPPPLLPLTPPQTPSHKPTHNHPKAQPLPPAAPRPPHPCHNPWLQPSPKQRPHNPTPLPPLHLHLRAAIRAATPRRRHRSLQRAKRLGPARRAVIRVLQQRPPQRRIPAPPSRTVLSAPKGARVAMRCLSRRYGVDASRVSV